MKQTVTIERSKLETVLEALQKSFPADGSKYEAELEQKHREAITAIKESLNREAMDSSPNGEAQPEQDTCKGCNGNGVVGNILDTVACPFCKGIGVEAQPEQEPVADSYSLADKVREALDRQSCPDAFMRIAWETIVKHYTTPPQRKPLSDEHLRAVWEPLQDALCLDYKVFARAIEAAHGIKE